MKTLILDEVESTQDVVKEWLKSNEKSSTETRADQIWVLAKAQKQGRGRQGRVWHEAQKPGDALYASWGQKNFNKNLDILLLPLVAGYALFLTLKNFSPQSSKEDRGIQGRTLPIKTQIGDTPIPFFMKWPNDIWLQMPAWPKPKKMAGVLVESVSGRNVIVGWGVNLKSVPVGVEHACAFAEVFATRGVLENNLPSTQEFLKQLQMNFELQLKAWTESRDYMAELIQNLELEAMKPLWGRKGVLRGPVIVEAVGLSAKGELRVRHADGQEQCVSAGEFTFL